MISTVGGFTFWQKCEFYKVHLICSEYLLMVVRFEIVYGQPADRAERLNFIWFDPFLSEVGVCSARHVKNIIQYAHFPSTHVARC